MFAVIVVALHWMLHSVVLIMLLVKYCKLIYHIMIVPHLFPNLFDNVHYCMMCWKYFFTCTIILGYLYGYFIDIICLHVLKWCHNITCNYKQCHVLENCFFPINAYVTVLILPFSGIDSSLPALELAKENISLNKLDPGKISFVREDATAFMKSAAARDESWDIVILDPPKLAPRRKVTFVLLLPNNPYIKCQTRPNFICSTAF